jgi:hypothetical protein
VLVPAPTQPIRTAFERIYRLFLSGQTREIAERSVVGVAIFGFLLHLILIGLSHYGFIRQHELLDNVLVAIYTPFSIILVFEVYLLVYYIPKSITRYIGKQYEIITLIVIRKIFNDVSKIEFTADWFNVQEDLQFTYDICAALILFFLISVFYTLVQRRKRAEGSDDATERFVHTKRWIAAFLVPLFVALAVYNVIVWSMGLSQLGGDELHALKNLNKIFFDEFFTVLILTDVLLLLVSFLFTQTFHQVIRNSGFVISTVLIKMSFGQEGIASTALTVAAVLIGVVVLYIYNRYDHVEPDPD